MLPHQVRRLFILIALLVVFTNLWAAEWTPIGRSQDGNIYLIDRTSVRSHGTVLQVWTMVNFARPNSDGAESQKTAFLINCESSEYATWSAIEYSGEYGSGTLVSSITGKSYEINYQPAIPDTVTYAIVTYVCSASR